jgi:anaerobic magnesium-protoporphyrin IX monomethyl ester cyclase
MKGKSTNNKKTKNVCFVSPQMPWQYNPHSDAPLGFLSVAQAARQHASKTTNFDVSFFDMAPGTSVPISDIYALGGTTLEYPTIMKVAEKLKERDPSSKIIIGGVHFDVFPGKEYWERKIDQMPTDIISIGEGEANIGKALEHIINGDTNIVIRQSGPPLDLSILNPPARDLLNKEDWFNGGTTFSNLEMGGGGKSATIMGSRGCPYKCSFCASPTIHRKKLRYFSSQQIIDELENLRDEYEITDLRWQDDNFPLTLRRSEDLGHALKEGDFRYRASLRADWATPEVLDNLWNTGCREVGFGIESAEQRVLDLNSKGTTVEENEKALMLSKERGFLVRAFMMSGLPGETSDSGRIASDFIERNQRHLDTITCTDFVPLPGTPARDNPEKFDITIIPELEEDWEAHNIAITGDKGVFPFIHIIDGMTKEKMIANLDSVKNTIFGLNFSNVSVYNKNKGEGI